MSGRKEMRSEEARRKGEDVMGKEKEVADQANEGRRNRGERGQEYTSK
jgi:hypothetical protein